MCTYAVYMYTAHNRSLTTYTLSTQTIHIQHATQVTYEGDQIRNFEMDGIAGLGFPGLAIITRPTLLELLAKDHPEIPQLFSVYLSNDPADVTRPSHMLLGGYDLNIVSSNASWHYTPVVRQAYGALRYWTVKVTGVSVLGRGEAVSGRRAGDSPLGGILGGAGWDDEQQDGSSSTQVCSVAAYMYMFFYYYRLR
jgi:Eukaryotic aspartyl protease